MNIKIPVGMAIGPPTLGVKDIQKQLSFYENDLDLQVNRRYKTDDNLKTWEPQSHILKAPKRQ